MRRIGTWLKRIGVAVFALIAGALGAAVGGHIIVDRRDMYGDDPKNDPYSIEYDPSPRRRHS